MAQTLKHSVALFEYVGASIKSFPAGTELPDWAWDQVKDQEHLHVPFGTDIAPRRIPRPNERTGSEKESDSGKPAHTSKTAEQVEEEEDEDELVAPDKGATKAVWAKFAKDVNENTDFDVVLTGKEDRDGIRAAVVASGAIED